MKQLRSKEQRRTEEEEVGMRNLCILFNKLGLTPVDISTSSQYLNSISSNTTSDNHATSSNANTINEISLPPLILPLSHSAHSEKTDIARKMSGTIVKTYTPSSWEKDIKTKKNIEFILVSSCYLVNY